MAVTSPRSMIPRAILTLSLVVAFLPSAAAVGTIPAGAPAALAQPVAEVTAQEQLVRAQWFIYDVNRARRDPGAYDQNFDPLPPLAVNASLMSSTKTKVDRMNALNLFSHLCPHGSDTAYCPDRLAARAGYPINDSPQNSIEAIWAGGPVGYPSAATFMGTRCSQGGTHMCLLFEWADRREIGAALVADGTTAYFATHVARRTLSNTNQVFATGVVFADDGDHIMDLWEGLGGIVVSAGPGLSTTTNAGGGWSLPVSPGTYQLTASGSGFPTATALFTVTTTNVGVDFERKPAGSTVAVVHNASAASPPCPSNKKCDTAVFVKTTTGQWYRHPTLGEGDPIDSFFFGNPGDIPFMGDWNCNGTKTPGLYRQSDGYVYLRNSNTQGNADITFFFGNPGDVPIVGDFNKNGCDTVSIYRPSQGRFFIINKLGTNGGGLGAADTSFYFGNPYDQPFVGDFDGDGQDTIGLYRLSTGFAYFRNSLDTGVADFAFFYGNPGDIILAGDWDGDGDDTVAVYRPSNGFLYLNYQNAAGPADYTLFVGYFSGAAAA